MAPIPAGRCRRWQSREMQAYLDLAAEVLEGGVVDDDRTGTGVLRAFGLQYRHDLAAGFPLLTTKVVHWPSVLGELLWFLSGSTRTDDLRARGVTIWDEWATAEQTAKFGRPAGQLGPVYGHQWRNFGATRREDGTYARDGIDQIRRVIDSIRAQPTSRRHVVSAWNPAEVDQVELPPCHTLFTFAVHGRRLSTMLFQRSADLALGVPFNLASYAALTHLIAHLCDLEPGTLVHSIADGHIYRNHVDGLRAQLERTPSPLPTLRIVGDPRDIDAVTADHFELVDYRPQGRIRFPVAV